jgi:PAS domain S-box-containing protein
VSEVSDSRPEQARPEQARPEQEGLARALLDSSPDGLLLVDPDGVILLANPSAATIFGVVAEELVGASIEDLVPEEIRSRHVEFRERYTGTPTSRSMGSGLRLFAQHPVGGLFPVEISLSPVTVIDGADGGEVTHTIATVRDVSDREETQARVVQMQERERIARDLHDMVIQRLFAAGMNLQAVSGATHRDVVDTQIAATIDDLDETIREIRNTIFHL